MNRFEENVKRGIALLDKEAPGWRSEVAPHDLDMDHCLFCVLGQVFSNYDKGLSSLELTELEAIQCGFNVPDDVDQNNYDIWFDQLRSEWIRQLTEEK